MLLGSWWACYSFKLHVMYFLRNATQIHICCINWGYWQWSAMNQIEKYFRFMNDTCSLYTWKLSGSFLFRCKSASRPHTIFGKCMPIMLPFVESEIFFPIFNAFKFNTSFALVILKKYATSKSFRCKLLKVRRIELPRYCKA